MRIIFEMANNHMGDLNHGIRLLDELAKVSLSYEFDFFLKFQFRDLETFIHPNYKGTDSKFVKRFEETRLSDEEWIKLFDAVRSRGFRLMVTPFDEVSVKKLKILNVDVLKIASCSLGDWPLFDEIGRTWENEIVASTAGASESVTDRAVDFILNRGNPLTLMHCVGLYPTPAERLSLGQIAYLKNRYPSATIGYSTHEDPADTVSGAMAYALGARTFEKHVGLETEEYAVNQYSATPHQVGEWLSSLDHAKKSLGDTVHKRPIGPDEVNGLRQLSRGVYSRSSISAGQKLSIDDCFFAIPVEPEALMANDWSKYSQVTSKSCIGVGEALGSTNVEVESFEPRVRYFHDRVVELIRLSGVVVPNDSELELSHHYGLEKFERFGLSMVTIINQSYCKKLLISLPRQQHPAQFHKEKSETFLLLWGDLELKLDGQIYNLQVGDVVTIAPGMIHEFVSKTGAVIEEISSTHFGSDSYYVDERINNNPDRKTYCRLRLG